MREIVFAHIPKTAGTSVRNGLVAALPDHFHLFDYGPNSSATTRDFADLIFGNPGFKGLRERLPGDHGTFVSGHFGIRKYWNVFHPSAFIVFVRNPIDRLFSEYAHFVRNYDYKESIETFVDNKRFRNVLFRHVNVEIAKIGFIGDSDRFEDSLAMLSRRLGCRIRPRRDNAAGGRQNPFGADAGLMARIRRLNREDIDFHRYLIDEVIPRNWARNDAPISPSRVTGTVEQAAPDRFDGVAFDLEGAELVDVDVHVGERKALTVTADRFDADLRASKRVTSGIGGFSVTREALAGAGVRHLPPGTELRFTALGRELQGSPLAIA